MGGISHGESTEAELAWFEAEVRPILVRRCYECHSGADDAQGDLRLDHREGWLQGGYSGPAIDLEEPAAGLLLRAVAYDDPDLQMPPRSKLPEKELATLREWARKGAPGPALDDEEGGAKKDEFDLEARRDAHWAWRAANHVSPPQVDEPSWSARPIDRFVYARLREKDLLPALPAESADWLRRVTFDLTGLPPTMAEVAAFVESDSPEERGRRVDELLGRVAFGEAWAQHWLDLVRYAETKGHEQDYVLEHAWRYRDYVIRALNANLPYDDFVTEHIAGDLLEEPRIDPETKSNQSVQATGFWRLGEATHSPVDIRGEEADRVDNQVDVFGKAFLGLTVACARCHDHKFDAISTEDYYAFCGFLQSSSDQVVNVADPRLRAEIASKLADLNEKSSAEVFTHFREAVEARLSGLTADDLDQATRDTLASLASAEAAVKATEGVVIDFATLVDAPGHDDWLTSGEAFGDRPTRVGQLVLEKDKPRVCDRPAASTQALSSRLTGLYRTRSFEVTQPKLWVLYRGAADFFIDVDSHRTVAGPLHGVLSGKLKPAKEWSWRSFDLARYVGHTAHFEVKPSGPFELATVVIGDRPGAPPALEVSEPTDLIPEIREALEAVGAGLATPRQAALATWLLNNLDSFGERSTDADEALRTALAEWRDARDALVQRLPAPQWARALRDGSAENERVHLRGSHKRLAEEPTQRRFLSALDGAFEIANGSGRMELANRVACATNPLTARVFVNRVWAKLLGQGIVPTVDNFGVLGAPPTHPELLDYLAAEFVRSGWDVKALIRRVVLSSAYGQASQANPGVPAERFAVADPANKLLHKARVRRVPAESIRDALLAISGELNAQPYGPSVPIHITDFMRHNRSPKGSGPMDGDRRRSIYLEVRRNALSHFLTAFDKPLPFTTIGQRTRSNSPAQALMLLNDPLVHHLAARWASRLLEDGASDSQAVREAHAVAFARKPDPTEEARLLEFIAARQAEAGFTREDAWADACLALINSKEFIYLR